MAVESLSPGDRALLHRCLELVATTRALAGDFETRLGVTRGELAEVLMRWPALDDRLDDAPATLAVANALNEVAHGLPLSAGERAALGTTASEVAALLARYATLRGWRPSGLR